MSEIRKTPVKVGGKNGVIVHDKLCADGPKDPVTGEPLIDPKTGEEYPGPNDDMAELMHDYLVFLRGNTMIDKGNSTAPRFGVLSLISMNTPIFVYDHPAFKKVANTAFTDGIHVFVDADFMRKLVIQENESDGRQSGVVFLLLHELMHKLYCHVDRLKNYPHDIANIAEDMVINGKLVKGFKLEPVKLLAEIGHGMKPEEAEKYHKMAEEVVAEMLLLQERKKQQQKKKQQQQQGGGGQGQPQPGGKGQKGQKGQGQGQSQPGGGGGDEDEDQDDGDDQDMNNSGGGGDEEDENGQDQENGKGKGKDGDEEGEYSPIHHISPEELLDIIEQEGLEESVGKKLNMPKAGDVEGIGKKKAQARLNDIDAVQTALAQASKANGQYPGQHIAEAAAELVSGLDRGKIVWKLGIRKHFLGDGLKLRETDDEAAIPWFLDKKDIGVDPFYMGALVPQSPDETVLCLIDTSGSTSGEGMRQAFLSEALSLKKGVSSTGDTAREVVLMSADTAIRGEPLIINEHNVNSLKEKGVQIFGNGGTDFARCLHEALKSKIMQKKKVKSVIYFTDCCDNPPRRADFEEYINKGIRIVFVTTPSMWNEQWNRDVGTFAEVYCIEEGTQANLDKRDGDYNTNTRRNRM